MKSLIRKILSATILKYKLQRERRQREFSNFEIAKAYRELKINTTTYLKDAALISVGIASAAFGLGGFLMPVGLIDGGATGTALLLAELTPIKLPVLLLLINIPFIILGYNIIGKPFAIKASLAICGLALVLSVADFPQITNDNVLVAVFGGFFLGAGIGLAVRGGAVLDGTEVLAIALSRKIGTTIGDIIIIINIIVFATAAKFLGIEKALYSMIAYLAASKTLDFVIEGIEEYTGITIVSSHSDEIRLMIINVMGRGVTVYKGKRGYGTHGNTNDIDIIYTVITRLEISKINNEILKIDPNAFVVMNSIKDTKGGMIKKRPFKH